MFGNIKTKKIIFTGFIFMFSLSGCDVSINLNDIFKGSNGNTVPSASPSSSNIPVKNSKYSFPLKLNLEPECTPEQNRTLYSINENNIFSYNVNGEIFGQISDSNKMENLDISKEEIDSLKNLIEEVDLLTLAEKDEVIPSGSPQTLECRAIESLIINIENKEKTFFLNDRKHIHKPEYKIGFEKIKNKLKEVKEKGVTQNKYQYSLPIKLTFSGECNGKNDLIFEVKDDGFFTYAVDSNKPDKYDSRILTKPEIEKLKDYLKELNISLLYEKSEKIPEGSPQTKECRTFQNYSFMVNGKETIFDYNGRIFNHTPEYKVALEKLKNYLEIFKRGFQLENELKLKIGDNINISSEKLELKLNSIVEESRCPSDVNCIQNGRVVFEFMATKDGNSYIFRLNNVNETNSVLFDKYKIELLKVFPESFKANEKPKTEDYLLTLKISKL